MRLSCKRGSLPRERSVAAGYTPKFRDAEYAGASVQSKEKAVGRWLADPRGHLKKEQERRRERGKVLPIQGFRKLGSALEG